MKRRRPYRQHFAFVRVEAAVALLESPRINRTVHVSQVLTPELPYWMTHGISKVFGASPATVFIPPGPMASIRKPFKERKINRGWLKFQAMINDGGDKIHGYDDGECEPQTRGIH